MQNAIFQISKNSKIQKYILYCLSIFTTDMFINANLTIFGATATDFPPLSNQLGPKAVGALSKKTGFLVLQPKNTCFLRRRQK